MTVILDRILPRPYREALADNFTLFDNPIFARESRRDSRRRDHTIFILVAFGILWLALAAAIALIRVAEDRGWIRNGISPMLGGSYGGLFLVLFSGIHYWSVYHAAWRRSSLFFLQEYRQNTLQSLLITRIPPFQLVAQAALYPFRQAMLVAALGLPFYVFALTIGGGSIWDLVGLYLLFAMTGFRPPRWSVPVFSGMSADDIVKRQRSGQSGMWGEYWIRGSPWLGFVALWFQGPLSLLFGKGWFIAAVYPLWTLVPRQVVPLMAAFALSWPLCLVRILMTPLPFYAFRIPALVFVLLLYLLARTLNAWESSLMLRTGDLEQIASLWDLPAYWRTRRIYWWSVIFVLLGYLWRPYVQSNLTASLISLRGASHALALTGLLWLLGSWATIALWTRVGEIAHALRTFGLDKLYETEPGRPIYWKRALAYILTPLAGIYGLYLIACLLTVTNPLPAPAIPMLAKLLAVMASGATIVAGISLRWRIMWAVWLIPLAAWILPLGPADRWVAAFSPLSGLLSLTPHTARVLAQNPYFRTEAPLWWQACAVAAIAGAIMVARRLQRGMSPAPARQAARLESRVEVTSATRPAVVLEFDTPELELPTEPEPARKRMNVKKDTKLGLRIIASLQKTWDNAVLTKEARTSLRGHLGTDELIALGCALLFVVGLVSYYAGDAAAALERPAAGLFGEAARGWAGLAGGLIGILSLVIGFVLPIAACTQCARAFTRERDKSTLGFMLVTPLSSREIVLGKLLGLLIPIVLTTCAIALIELLLAIPVAAAAGPISVLIGFLFTLVAPAALIGTSAVCGIAFSTIMRRENDAGGAALLSVIVVAGVSVFLAAILPWESTTAWALAEWSVIAITLCGALSVAAYRFSVWRIDHARHTDIAFEAASPPVKRRK